MHPRSEMGESEADADASSYTGSVFSDGLHHTGSASGHYHYFVVSPSPDAFDLHIPFEKQGTERLQQVLCSWDLEPACPRDVVVNKVCLKAGCFGLLALYYVQIHSYSYCNATSLLDVSYYIHPRAMPCYNSKHVFLNECEGTMARWLCHLHPALYSHNPGCTKSCLTCMIDHRPAHAMLADTLAA